MNSKFKCMIKKVAKVILPILICITMIVIGAFSYRLIVHPNDYRYNDQFVLGNTKENIIRAYGNFDEIDIVGNCGYYVRSAPEYDEFYTKICYVIEFNKQDIATDVYLAYVDDTLSWRKLSEIARIKWFMQQLTK